MATLVPTLTPGSSTTNTYALSDLGNLVRIGNNDYRVVKAAADIATPAKKAVVSTVATHGFTWSVNTSTTANDPLVVGVIPATYTATITSGSYFLVQVSGVITCIAAAAIAAGAPVGCSTTAGKIDDASITAGVGAIGVSLEAGTNADDPVGVMLKGLV